MSSVFYRYECQVLIRLEIMSTLDNKDQAEGEEDVNDEVSF